MKRIIISALLTAVYINSFAQSSLYISAGANVVVTGGATLSVDGFSIKPTASYTIAGLNSVTRDAVTVPASPTTYIQRVYHFLSSLPAFTGEITYYYLDAELNGLNENLLNLNLYNGTTWTLYAPSARDNVNNFITTTGLTNVVFNQATLAQVQLLPVTLTNVKAYQKNGGVQIEWRSEQEVNIDNYEAERSPNGVQFSSIASVTAKGNGSAVTDYALFDAKPNSGINYYRIKITDKDGKIKYSIVMKVNIAADQKSIAFYPNPVTENMISLQLNNLPKGVYIVSVSNKTGQTIATKKINHPGGSASESVDFSKAVGAGIYQLKLMGENVNITKEIIKN